VVDNFALDRLAGFKDLLELAPALLGLRTSQGKDGMPLSVLGCNDGRGDRVTNGRKLRSLPFTVRDLIQRHHGFCLGANVHENLVPINLDDDSFYYFSSTETAKRPLTLCEQVLHI